MRDGALKLDEEWSRDIRALALFSIPAFTRKTAAYAPRNCARPRRIAQFEAVAENATSAHKVQVTPS